MKQLSGDPERVGMRFDTGLHGMGITSAKRDRARQAPGGARFQNTRVAALQSSVRQIERSETVLREAVHARLVEHDVRLEGKHVRQHSVETV